MWAVTSLQLQDSQVDIAYCGIVLLIISWHIYSETDATVEFAIMSGRTVNHSDIDTIVQDIIHPLVRHIILPWQTV